MAQFPNFYQKGTNNLLEGGLLYTMFGLTLLTMLIIWGLPKLTKTIPSSLVAIVVVSAIVIGFDVDTLTVAGTMGEGETIKGGFPPLSIPQIPLTLETFMIILPYAAIVAGVGLIESLLTLILSMKLQKHVVAVIGNVLPRVLRIYSRAFCQGWVVVP